MAPRILLVPGQRFARLTVVARAEPRKGRSHRRWLCLCDCGRQTIVEGTNLVHSYTKSCGCRVPIIPGHRYGRLIVLGNGSRNAKGKPRWLCRCDCGAQTLVHTHSLVSGNTKSCGCLFVESVGIAKTRHGHTRGPQFTPEYRAWAGMKTRCLNPNWDARWKYYGGRGVTVCDRWRDSFEAFYADMGPKPSPQHSLDRFPNNDGNYEPGNTRWATKAEQAHNRRPTVKAALRAHVRERSA